MRGMLKHLFLFSVGGLIYFFLEIIFRGHSHPTMIAVGGICFMFCGWLNEDIPWEMPLQIQMLICAIMITIIEFGAGMILNVYLHLSIWDYSNLPFNLMGQVCLPFTILWFFLSLIAIVLDDYLRYWLFGEQRPRYSWRWL